MWVFRGLVSDGELFFFFFFFLADGSELGMLAMVIDKVEGDAQSKRGCWKSGGGTIGVERERERRESFIEKFKARLVYVFKQQFSIFKQYYTYFHTLFYL